MQTLDFNTFANTPNTPSAYPSKLPTQQSFNPHSDGLPSYTNIPQLKKQMQEALNAKPSARPSHHHSRVRNKYDSQVSLMKSGISVLSVPDHFTDLPQRLQQLELGLTEDVLAIREDKITLMEAYNKVLADRYRVERELNRLKKQASRQEEHVEELTVFAAQDNKPDIQQGRRLLKRNEQLKAEIQQLQSNSRSSVRQSQQQTFDQIEALQRNCQLLEQQIAILQQNIRGEDESRFETFLPSKNSPPRTTAGISDLQELKKLREDRDVLLRHLADWSPSTERRAYFYELIQQNRVVLEKHHRALTGDLRPSFGSVGELRQRVDENEKSKELFRKDLLEFKEKLNAVRQENRQLRARISKKQI